MPRAGLDPETITEAAALIIESEGLAALTLARLAGEFGVAPPSLYKHVAGLNDLIQRITTLAIRRLTDNLAAAALGRSGRQALIALAETYRRFATEHGGLYALTQTVVVSGATQHEIEASRIVEIFAAVLRSYNVPDGLLIHAIRIVRSGLHGFVDIELHGGFQMPDSVDRSFLLLNDALDAALINLALSIV